MIKSLPLNPRMDGAIESDPQYQKYKCKNKQQKNSSLLSSTMRRDYTLENFPYGTHHRDVLLGEVFESPLA